MIMHCPRARVTPDDGRTGDAESLKGGGVRCVRDVDKHAEAVHFVDQGVTKGTTGFQVNRTRCSGGERGQGTRTISLHASVRGGLPGRRNRRMRCGMCG